MPRVEIISLFPVFSEAARTLVLGHKQGQALLQASGGAYEDSGNMPSFRVSSNRLAVRCFWQANVTDSAPPGVLCGN